MVGEWWVDGGWMVGEWMVVVACYRLCLILMNFGKILIS